MTTDQTESYGERARQRIARAPKLDHIQRARLAALDTNHERKTPTMRTALTASAVAALAVAAIVGTGSEAVGATVVKPCFTNAEYRAVVVGSTDLAAVTRLGGHGVITFDADAGGEHWQDREYRRCGLDRWHKVSVDFTDGVVTYKGRY